MQEKETNCFNLRSLVSLEDFKALLGLDDRDDRMSRYCLVTSTFAIEEYCRRRLFLKTVHQVSREWPDLTIYLNEYPVREVLSVYALIRVNNHELIEPEFYRLDPMEEKLNIPYSLVFTTGIRNFKGMTAIKVIYSIGFLLEEVPADLSAACLELASWNMGRLKGKQIGVQGAKDKDQLELSMPLNVKQLLEPYRRKVI